MYLKGRFLQNLSWIRKIKLIKLKEEVLNDSQSIFEESDLGTCEIASPNIAREN